MEWACGISTEGGLRVQIIERTGNVMFADLASLRKHGLPSKPASEGSSLLTDPSSWKRVPTYQYLEAFGAASLEPAIASNHQVFAARMERRTVYIPALALMRAMFRPNSHVLPAVFSPGNVDLLSYVDYSAATPRHVVHDAGLQKSLSDTDAGPLISEPLRWLQLSRSARDCCQSVHKYAMQGRIDLDPPAGDLQMSAQGHAIGRTLFVTRLELIAVHTRARDTLLEKDKTFRFRSTPIATGSPKFSCRDLVVPINRAGLASLTDQEWDRVLPLLQGKGAHARTKHNPRHVLDAILSKIAHGHAWRHPSPEAPNVPFSIANTRFRELCADGSLLKILDYLQKARGEA